ncbi:hypothetical protein QJS04_geneDACA021257 [Acorus gramineus]|uniref:Uncharacterized protein n=1 Tax=Acorus gramineus TaxID=55184 RepID=A0AAV9BSD0_ACOGR|nr:hypothetical protein QJS04_geneDACA021257 [Acorus gramineus]
MKYAAEKELTSAKEKEELSALVNALQSQLQSLQSNTKQVVPGTESSISLTKHVDSSDANVDKACLSDSRTVTLPRDAVVQLGVDRVDVRQIGDGEWSDIQSMDSRIADVREISSEPEGSSLDISVVSPAVHDHEHQGE